MKSWTSRLAALVHRHDEVLSPRQAISREWERQRAAAGSASERAEIDAIFSRHL